MNIKDKTGVRETLFIMQFSTTDLSLSALTNPIVHPSSCPLRWDGTTWYITQYTRVLVQSVCPTVNNDILLQ